MRNISFSEFPDARNIFREITMLKATGAGVHFFLWPEISKSVLKAFEFDATESPDLFPPLVALASYCNGVTKLKGAARLLHKESDRAAALSEEFGKMNINVELKDDYLLVTGGKVKGTRV